MNTCEQIQERLSAYLDGELTQQDEQRVGLHVRECPRCRDTYEEFSRMRQDIKRLDYPDPSDAEWGRLVGSVAKHGTRGAGWLLWIGGSVVLVGYGLFEFITDPSVDALVRVCVLAVLLGVVLVFLTVLLERVAGYGGDKYKDVQR